MENEEMKKDEKVVVTGGSIDKEVLNVMKQEDILKAISDQTQANRLILNCFCEFLEQIGELKKDFDEFNQMLSVCSSDKMANFFKQIQTNTADEVKRQNALKKVRKSHLKAEKSKKSTKKTKNQENVINFVPKDIK